MAQATLQPLSNGDSLLSHTAESQAGTLLHNSEYIFYTGVGGLIGTECVKKKTTKKKTK